MNKDKFMIRKDREGDIIIKGYPIMFDFANCEGHIKFNEETALVLAEAIKKEVARDERKIIKFV